METIKLDLIPGKKMPSLHASQYDDGRKHGIDLFENGIAYKLDGTETLTINERKVDNNICSMDIENTFTGSSHIEFASFLQMCACAGSNFCELRISKGDVDIGTLNFILEVEPDPTADGIESESEIRNLERQIEDITEEVIGDDYYTAEQTDDAIATAIEGKADTTYVNEELAKKADKIDTYTKSQVDNALNNKMNKANPTGTGSIAVGIPVFTIASGNYAQAFGTGVASGDCSTAIGDGTTANHRGQFVFGANNIPDDSTASANSRGKYVEIVGNGGWNPSNARTLDWQGNETLAGDLTYNGNKSLSSEISRLDGRIDNLPAPMIFKGTLGVGGTIQSLPTASASNEGFTYKVITDGTYAGQTAKIGDVFISNGSAWVYIPSGDEDNDTWRAVKVNGVEKLGNGISSGAVDFEDTANVKFEFDANGNKVRARLDGIYTESEVDELLDDKADADNTYTKEQVDDIVYNILPDDTASGSVANFDTSLELPIKSLEVDVNAVQESGTPTPVSPLPISGWSEISLVKCGSNLWNREWEEGAISNTTGLDYSSTNYWRTVGLIPIKPNTEYYICSPTGVSGNSIGLRFYGADKSYVGYTVKSGYGAINRSFVSPDNAYFLRFNPTNANCPNHDISLNYPSTDTTYHNTYNGNTEVISLGGTYYGGHFTQDKAGHRQFEITHAKEHISLQDRTPSTASGYDRYSIPISSETTAGGLSAGKKCSVLESYAYSDARTSEHFYLYSTSLIVFFVENTFRNGEFDVMYPLATPYVIDLPDGEPIITINGTNNIYADTGDTSVVFKSSVNDYVSAHSGGNLLGMGGVYLGGAKSGGGEEEPDEGEDTEKTKLDEPKEEIKTIGDTKKLGGE